MTKEKKNGRERFRIHPCLVVDARCEFMSFFLNQEPQLPSQQDDSVRPNAFQVPSSPNILYAAVEAAQPAETDRPGF